MNSLPASVLRATDQICSQATPETNVWLNTELMRNVEPNLLVAKLIESGRSQETAALLVSLALQGMFLRKSPVECIASEECIDQSVGSHAETHWVDGGDRQIRKTMSLGSLDAVLYEDFLSNEEIHHLQHVASSRLQRSKVMGTHAECVDSARTSNGAYFQLGEDAIIAAIEARVARVTDVPATHGEGLQVLHYTGTQEYQPHFDYFEPASELEMRAMEITGNRIGTLIFYLSDVEKGGSTYFPQLKLSIHPKRGSALWFGYIGSDGRPDTRSFHAGLPVLCGEKWIATKWLRQRPFPSAATS